jgi:hypothetical protein
LHENPDVTDGAVPRGQDLAGFTLMRVTPDELEGHAETLELINAELTARLDRQANSSAKIDTKAIVLAGYVVAAASFLATQHPQPVLASLAYAAYIVTFGLNVFVYAVGTYHDVPDPRRLLNGYAMRTKPQVLGALAAERVKAFDANARRHERKARLWQVSLVSLAVGVTLMVVSVIGHTNHHGSTAGSGKTNASPTARAVTSRP